ncbi:MAG: LiaF-related protein [Bacteroidales bacterium]|nr:LiaF-related protein [Bacteroidales bacterium]
MKEQEKFKSNSSFGIFVGIILISGGLIYLLNNLGYVEKSIIEIVITFPMLLLLLSLYWIFRKHFFWGFLGVLASLIFLVPKVSTFYPNLITFPFENLTLENTILPILFILFGIAIISKVVSKPKKYDKEYEFFESLRENNFIQKLFSGKNVIFGSSKNMVIAPLFKGTEINTVFGGAILDLRKTDIEEGETIVEVNVVFGGAEIYVPSNWEIVINTTSILGATEDKRFYTDEKTFSNKKLIIKGSCIFGGVEIKN